MRGKSGCSKWAYYQELMVCVIWPPLTQEPGNEAIAAPRAHKNGRLE